MYQLEVDRSIFSFQSANMSKKKEKDKELYPPHPLTEKILARIKEALNKEKIGKSWAKVGERCQTTGATAGRIASGKRGEEISLDMALNLWTGCGFRAKDLIPDTGEGLELVEFASLRKSEDWEIINKFLEIYLNKNLLRRRIYFTILSQHISAIYEELEILKEKEASSA